MFKPILLTYFFSISFLSLLLAPDQAIAGPLKKYLRKDQKLDVRSKRCALFIRSGSTEKLDIRCGPQTQSGITPNRKTSPIYLAPRARTVITARDCFLSPVVLNSKRIKISCLASLPTTPTVAPTSTPTLTPTATATPTANANVLLNNSSLISFNTTFPAGASGQLIITGLNVGDSLVSIDRRPQNGMLYGLGYNSAAGTVQLYQISSATGVASAVGATGAFVDASSNAQRIGVDASTKFGMDFNPTVDRIRVVSSNGQNFRVNPNTGEFIDGNLNISPTPTGVNMDGAINGATTSLDETAYTNSSPNQTVTTQYTIDSATDSLYIQNPPNAGNQTQAIALSSAVSAVLGFDIPSGVDVTTSNTPVTIGSGYAILELASNSQQRFSSIELNSGVITSALEIPTTSNNIVGLSVHESTEVPMVALSANGTQLVRFNASTPDVTSSVNITGVDASEILSGLDFRPSTGQLYSLGVNDGANTATLYLLDPQTGTATTVGSTGAVSLVDNSAVAIDLPAASTGYAFNFNPVVDLIRVVTSTGINFRINPVTGAAVDSDTGVSGTNPDGNVSGGTVNSASYTNAFAGSTVTTLYTVDALANALYIQNPPNNGNQTNLLPLMFSGSPVDPSAVTAFEIATETKTAASNAAVNTGTGYIVATIGGISSLYRVDLTNGSLTNLGITPAYAGLAVAQTKVN